MKRKEKWLIQARFRYFRDEKIGRDSADERNFFAWEAEGSFPEEKIISTVRGVVDGLKRHGFGFREDHRMVRSGDPEEFKRAMQSLSCMTFVEEERRK